MERILIRSEHLSTPASRTLRLIGYTLTLLAWVTLLAWMTLLTWVTLLAWVTGAPKAVMDTLLHGMHPKNITMHKA